MNDAQNYLKLYEQSGEVPLEQDLISDSNWNSIRCHEGDVVDGDYREA